MSRTERVLNLLLGLSVLSWSLLGLLQPLSLPRLVISALNAVVGYLLIARSPLVRSGSINATLLSIPGVVIAGIALKLSQPLVGWSWAAQALFATGGALTVAAFLVLGKSFAILPALRTLVRSGPFKLVRHPAYAGELLMVSACFVARPSWTTGAAFLVAIPLVALRIHVEEGTLLEDRAYADYANDVRYRLVPGVW